VDALNRRVHVNHILVVSSYGIVLGEKILHAG